MNPSVLIVPSWYPSADNPTAGVFVKQQVIALRDAGVAVAVLVEEDRADTASLLTDEDGVLTVRYSSGLGALPGAFRKARLASVVLQSVLGIGYAPARRAFAVLEEAGFKPDIIHVHALWPAAIGARSISSRTGIPFVVTEHSEEYSAGTERKLIRTPGMLPLVLRPLARRASAYIAPSRSAADRLVRLGLSDSVQVIPNVVPTRQPAPWTTNEVKHIVHVSLLSPSKNLSLLLQAIARLRERRDNFILDIAGDGHNRKAVEAFASGLGLADSVVFHGRATTEEVNAFLDGAVCGVITSNHETFSVFAVECLMAGRPVVATRCGGPEEFITSEVGVLVERGDLEGLVEALDAMLDRYVNFSPHELNAYATSLFSPQVVVEKLLDIYEAVLGI